MFTRFLVINNLRKVLAILGCLLFVFSFIYPLYYAEFITLAGGGSTYYWSYKVDYRIIITVVFHQDQYWFSNYWFSSYGWIGLGIPWILISLFTVQVLTLVFGIASIIFKRRILSFTPVLLSLTAIALVIYIGMIVAGIGIYWWQYQLGYYLIYPSAILFMSAFALNEVTNKRQTIEPAKENPNTLSSSV
jgi:hypothetical protein